MFSKWSAHLTADKQHEFKMQVSAAQPVVKRLLSLLNEELVKSKDIAQSKSAYENASWPYLQADSIGEQRAYNRVIKLLANIEN